MTSIAILQPTYHGWLGYFDLIARADTVVLLDNVQIDRQSWQTRNRIRARDGETVWLTVPVHAHIGDTLKDVEIAGGNWRQKHLRTIRSAYRHATHWETLASLLEPSYAQDWRYLCDLTTSLIIATTALLGCQTPIHRASLLGTTRAGRTERLIDLCRLADADTLIEPIGGQYLQDANLDEIRLEWHDYQHPVYDQGGKEFLSHLSILDFLAWCGPDAFRTSRKPS